MQDEGRQKNRIQHKIMLSFAVIAVELIVGCYFILSLIIFPSFEKFERDQSRENLARAEQAISYQLEGIATFNRYNAWWDGLYSVMNTPSEMHSFVDDFMLVNNWRAINVDGMLIFDATGNFVDGKLLDNNQPGELQPGRLLANVLTRAHPAVRDSLGNPDQSDVKGLISTPVGILMIASHPILTSAMEGPSRGRLISARYLNTKRIQKIANRAKVNLNIFPIEGGDDPQAIANLLATLEAAEVPYVTQKTQDNLTSSAVLRDLSGNPLAIVQTKTATSITLIGSDSVMLSLLFLSLGIVIAIFLSWLALRHWMVKPLLGLKSHISNVRRTGDLSKLYNNEQDDEIGTLAREFDFLAIELGQSQHNLVEARDRAEAASKAKSEFLANMSHEIRTPMNGVIGMTEVLLRTELSTRQQHLAHTVKTSGEMLLKVINNILDFSKISAGKAQIDNTTFQTKQLIQDISAVVAESAQSKGIEYLVKLERELPKTLIADEQRIKQVLVNLIGNAIKFTEQGEVVLSIERMAEKETKGENCLTLGFRVSDTGTGIRREALPNIFNSFSQADNSTTRDYGGTGLGLTISKGLAEMMNGTIEVSSVYGQGSEFLVTLPVRVAQTALQMRPFLKGGLKGVRALVVDDNRTNLDIIQAHLDHWQAECHGVSSGVEALTELNNAAELKQMYQLILIDHHMPGMDGASLAEHISADKRFSSTVMIMLSSVTDEFTQESLTALGISSYLTKPIVGDQLYQNICQALDGSSIPNNTLSNNDIDEPNTTSAAALHGVDILVAEDNPVNQELIFLQLQELGARIELSDNGELAIEKLREKQFDLVIMDCQMPVLDGYAATRRIRNLGITAKNGQPVPVLAMTANAHKADRKACIDAGMNDYLSKPYSFDKLLETLQCLLPQKDRLAPVAEQTTHGMALDAKALAEVRQLQRQGAPNILHRLIDIYLETSPELVDDLLQGASKGDARVVELNAHSLKSSSARLGASELADLCLQLEEMGRTTQLDNIGTLLERLNQVFNQVCEALCEEKQRA